MRVVYGRTYTVLEHGPLPSFGCRLRLQALGAGEQELLKAVEGLVRGLDERLEERLEELEERLTSEMQAVKGSQELLTSEMQAVKGSQVRLEQGQVRLEQGQVRLERTGGDNTESLSRVAHALSGSRGYLRPRELKFCERHALLGSIARPSGSACPSGSGAAPAACLPTLGWLPAARCMRPAPRVACGC